MSFLYRSNLDMHVFLSWSGEPSKSIAQIFSDWLPSVLQAVKPFFSPDDVEKGSRWSTDIAKNLEESENGLMFLTSNNLQSPWLLFEGGAISKKIDTSKVVPLLFGIATTDLTGPLQQFQAAPFNHDEMYKLVSMLNRELGERGLSKNVLDTTFEKWWPDLEVRVSQTIQSHAVVPRNTIRSEREMIEEVLEISRLILVRNPASVRTPESEVDFGRFFVGNTVLTQRYGEGKVVRFEATQSGKVGVVIDFNQPRDIIYELDSPSLKWSKPSTGGRKPAPPPVDDDLDESDPFANE